MEATTTTTHVTACTKGSDKGSDMAVAGDVMIGLGVVAAAAGAVFFFVEQRLLGGEPNAAKKKKKAGIDFGILPGGFSIQGRF